MPVWHSRLSGRAGKSVYWAALIALATLVVWQAITAGRRASAPLAETDGTEELGCEPVAQGSLEALPEASGLALSRRTPGVLWSLDDSGAPVVIALGPAGRFLGRVRITGADVNNWEDVSVAPCDKGSCLYIADAGNGGGTQRNDVVIFRVQEPDPHDKATSPADVFNAEYPDGEDHEAEALFVIDGRMFLVTKGHPSLLFAFPRELPSGSLVTLERIGQVPTERFLADTIPRRTRITDAETSPDGRWVALRTNERLLVYRSADVIAHQLNHLWQADLRSLGEIQGEGAAISNDGDVYLAGEGGGHDRPGTFAHIKCAMPE